VVVELGLLVVAVPGCDNRRIVAPVPRKRSSSKIRKRKRRKKEKRKKKKGRFLRNKVILNSFFKQPKFRY